MSSVRRYLVAKIAAGTKMQQVTVEFDCDIEGEDVDDGWQDDLDDHSDDQEGAQNAQRLEDGEEHDEDNPDMDRPGDGGIYNRI